MYFFLIIIISFSIIFQKKVRNNNHIHILSMFSLHLSCISSTYSIYISLLILLIGSNKNMYFLFNCKRKNHNDFKMLLKCVIFIPLLKKKKPTKQKISFEMQNILFFILLGKEKKTRKIHKFMRNFLFFSLFLFIFLFFVSRK